MSMRGLKQVLDYLRQSLPPDGQLLLRFVAARDEAAFAALVRRHGPMVFGVCRRVLRHTQDAEDAFQATFLILARKAESVLKRESVGSWLYRVAYHTALEARDRNLRRRRHERQVEDMPHPTVGPAEPRDWRPLLDRELNGLPEKYREAVVLCDLEGRSRKEAAHLLGLPEGTLASRLARARRLLARKLARYGLTLSGGALATALSEGAAAAVPPGLVQTTVTAGLLVAAGQLAAVSTPAALLMKGVLNAMFLTKLKIVVAAVLMTVALGMGGIAFRAAEPAAPGGSRPPTELETLRKENELLRLNLLVLLEKIHAQEAQLAALKGPVDGGSVVLGGVKVKVAEERELADKVVPEKALNKLATEVDRAVSDKLDLERLTREKALKEYERMLSDQKALFRGKMADLQQDVEAALKALREANDLEARRRAMEALDRAVRKLREQTEKASPSGEKGEKPAARP